MEADVAMRAMANVHAIDPDIAVVIDAVELDGDFLIAIRRRQPEMLAIPPDAVRRPSVRSAARRVLAERALDAPVVRQLELSPARIVERRSLRVADVALEKLPVEVE
jgi:hypothetical protein